MNAELQIAAAVASIRGQARPQSDRMAAGPTRAGNRVPARNKDGHPKRFQDQSGGVNPSRDPWPPRPGISRTVQRYAEATVAIASKPLAMKLAALVFIGGCARVALDLMAGASSFRVIHLVLPV